MPTESPMQPAAKSGLNARQSGNAEHSLTPALMPDGARDRVRAWLSGDALPLWAEKGVEPNGAFLEQLTTDGAPDPDAVRRIRVQARQVYVFAQATLLGLGDWRDEAAHGLEWLVKKGWDEKDGGFFHHLNGDGTVANGKKDTYDHAFVLFALAHAKLVDPHGIADTWIGKTMEYIERDLTDADAPGALAFHEGVPRVLPRRQNPHMHLTEAFLALHNATGDSAYLERAGKLVDLFRSHFFHKETDTLAEFFTDDFKPVEGDPGLIVEPGHHFEWVYLLDAYADAALKETLPEAEALFAVARARGIDPVSGLVYDEIWRDGGTAKETKRMWPQTEALRAHVIRAKDDSLLVSAAEEWLDRIFRYYLDPAPAGTWRDVMGADNRPVEGKPIPASTFYHVLSAFSAVLEA